MAITRPTGDQLRFNSSANGELILDAYLEAAEKGGRQLGDLISDIFDSSGEYRTDIFQFREDPSNLGIMQVRIGTFTGANDGWVNLSNTDFNTITQTVLGYKNSAETASNTATTKAGEASTSASNASTSESNASTSASNASTSESNASTSASNAATSASNASTSESNASGSASTASTHANTAQGFRDTASTHATTATTKAGEASTSASNASTSEGNASTSASTATTQAGIATTKAGEAATSASAASTSASNAATSETNAATSLASFDDKYLGAKSSVPSTDNNGNTLGSNDTGTLYFNTTSDKMFVWNGSSFAETGSAVNGTSNRASFTATANQTTFAINYDVGYVDCYINGVKLSPADITATNGSQVVLASGAAVGDQIDLIAYGAFALANVYTQTQTYTKTEVDNLLTPKATTTDLATTNTNLATTNTNVTNLTTTVGTKASQADLTALTSTVATKAPLASPNFTGTPQIGGVNIATTASIPAATTGMSGDFVASGAIGNKATVILNANGTVTAVAGTATSTGSSTAFAPNTNVNNTQTNFLTGYYDDNVNKVVVFYADQTDSHKLKGVVGTVSGTSISFTSPTLIHNGLAQYIDCDFLNVGSINAGLVLYKDATDNQKLYARYIQVSSSGAFTIGANTLVYSGISSWSTVCANTVGQCFTAVYEDENNNRYGTAVPIIVSATGIFSIGTPAVIWSGAMWRNNVVFAENTSNTSKQCHICFSQYYNTSNGQSTLIIVPFHVTNSPSITQGTAMFTNDTALHGLSLISAIDAVSFGNGRAAYCALGIDASNNYEVFSQIVEATSTQAVAQGSGSPEFSKVQNDAISCRITYNSHIDKICLLYKDATGSGLRSTYVRYGSPTSSSLTGFSGSGITWDAHAQINGSSEAFSRFGVTHDSTTNQDVVFFYDTGSSGNDQNGKAKTISPPSTNSGNGFIGISDAAIADTATGKVTVSGGLVTGLSGLTAKSDYYVQDDGSLATTVTAVKAGYALNATQMLLYGIEA